MAPTADETKRQIEQVRAEVTEILRELDTRRQRALEIPLAAPSLALGAVQRTAERNPIALAPIGLGVLLGLLGFVAWLRRRSRRERQPAQALRRRFRAAADEVGEYLGRAREAVPLDISVRSGRATRKLMEREPGMLKKLLWMGLTSAMMALGGLVARRVSAAIWQNTMREQPPTRNV